METQKRGRKPKAGTQESPKVKNVQVQTAQTGIDETPYEPRAKVRSKPTYDVFIKGRIRQLTKSAFNVAVKDPSLQVELPPDSNLEIPKPCEGC